MQTAPSVGALRAVKTVASLDRKSVAAPGRGVIRRLPQPFIRGKSYPCETYIQPGAALTKGKGMSSKPLATLPRALADAGYNPPSYPKVHRAAAGVVIPAERSETGRWSYDPADLDKIAQALSLTRADARAAA